MRPPDCSPQSLHVRDVHPPTSAHPRHSARTSTASHHFRGDPGHASAGRRADHGAGNTWSPARETGYGLAGLAHPRDRTGHDPDWSSSGQGCYRSAPGDETCDGAADPF